MKKALGISLNLAARTALILTLLLPGAIHGADSLQKPAADEAEAKKAAEELLALYKAEGDVTNSLGAIMVWTPGSYRVGKTEVTQEQYQKVMGENPSHFPGANRPVEMVSPTQAMAFCARLTEMEHKSGELPPSFAYALPSEQDFDGYVDGTPLETAYVSSIGDRHATVAVGSLPANKLGLHDVRGNVWEWCSGNVARGASYQSHEDYLAPSFRFVGDAGMRVMDIGFRIVLRGTK